MSLWRTYSRRSLWLEKEDKILMGQKDERKGLSLSQWCTHGSPHLLTSFILFVLLQYLAGVVDSISTQWENASSLCFMFADVRSFSFVL